MFLFLEYVKLSYCDHGKSQMGICKLADVNNLIENEGQL